MHNALVRPIMAFAYCIFYISAFVKKEETEEKEKNRQDRSNEEKMRRVKKIESAIGDNMRNDEKEIKKKKKRLRCLV